jgi:hypothetical protein
MLFILIIAVTLITCSFISKTVLFALTGWIAEWKWETNPQWIAPVVKAIIYGLLFIIVIFCTFCLGIMMIATMSGGED